MQFCFFAFCRLKTFCLLFFPPIVWGADAERSRGKNPRSTRTTSHQEYPPFSRTAKRFFVKRLDCFLHPRVCKKAVHRAKVIKTSASSSSCNQIEYSRSPRFCGPVPGGPSAFSHVLMRPGGPSQFVLLEGSFVLSHQCFMHHQRCCLRRGATRTPLVEAQVFR